VNKTTSETTLSPAPFSLNVCCEHPKTNPRFQQQPTRSIYAQLSNVIGDSSPGTGYVRIAVEDEEGGKKPDT